MARSAFERSRTRPLGVRREVAEMKADTTGPLGGDRTRKAVTPVVTCSFNDVWGKVIY